MNKVTENRENQGTESNVLHYGVIILITKFLTNIINIHLYSITKFSLIYQFLLFFLILLRFPRISTACRLSMIVFIHLYCRAVVSV